MSIGDRAVVERVDLQQPIAAGDDGVLVRGRPRRVDDRRRHSTPASARSFEHEILAARRRRARSRTSRRRRPPADAWRRCRRRRRSRLAFSNRTLIVGVLVWPPIIVHMGVGCRRSCRRRRGRACPSSASSASRSSSKSMLSRFHQHQQLLERDRRAARSR